jgi:uncharacterized protein (DUF736 family)
VSGGEFDNNRRGALFENDKQGNPKRPDWRGQCEIDGVKWWVSAWEQRSKKGQPYLALRFEPQQAQEHAGAAKNPPPRRATGKTETEPFNDDIPF